MSHVTKIKDTTAIPISDLPGKDDIDRIYLAIYNQHLGIKDVVEFE